MDRASAWIKDPLDSGKFMNMWTAGISDTLSGVFVPPEGVVPEEWYGSTDWYKHVYSSALIVYGGYKTIQATNKTVVPSRISASGNTYDINKLQKTQPYVYPKSVASIKESILQNGPNSVPPIEIRIHHGQALAVDGHHRLEAFRQLGYDRVPIKYLHSSQLGKMFPDGSYYRTIEELLDAAKISN